MSDKRKTAQARITGRLRVVIVDDEPAGRRAIRDGCGLFDDIEIIGEFGDPRAALVAIRSENPDVVFLDIKMDTMSGIDLAAGLQNPSPPIVVFVTAFDEFALQAFEVSAADYLTKPFDDIRFRKMVERVRHRHSAESAMDREQALASVLERLNMPPQANAPGPQRLLAEANGRFQMLEVSAIEVVEANRNYVRITVGNESFHARSTLQHAEETLRSEPMLRISRSCLINTRHLREVNKTLRGDFILVLSGGTTVTSSEGFRERVREFLDGLRLQPGRG
ncbi:MAG: LytTR family DNA-binding domain-containing protein [Steroidobacteraceae bacterium]